MSPPPEIPRIDPITVARRLAALRPGLLLVRQAHADETSIPGVMLCINLDRRGPYPSTNRNRAHMPGGTGRVPANPGPILVDAFARVGIQHFFAWLSPCQDQARIESELLRTGFRLFQWTEYITFAKRPQDAPPVHSSPKPGRALPTITRLTACAAEACRDQLIAVFDGSAEWAGDFTNGADKPGMTALACLEGGVPVAAAIMYVHDRLAYFGGGAVHKDHRGRGLQRLLINERCRLAAAADCDLCIAETLTNLPHSLNNIQRCGFQEAYRARVLEWGTPDAAHSPTPQA